MFLVTIVLFVLTYPSVHTAAQTLDFKGFRIVNVQVDEKLIDSKVPAINVDGTTMVPLRVISESLGAKVEWDERNFTVMISQKPNSNTGQTEKTDREKIIYQLHDIHELFVNLDRALRIAKEYYDIRNNARLIDQIQQVQIKEIRKTLNELNITLSDSKLEQEFKVQSWEVIRVFNECLHSYDRSVNQLMAYTNGNDKGKLELYIDFFSSAYTLEQTARKQIRELP